MATNRFTNALEEGRRINAPSVWSRQVEQAHQQINEVLEEVRAAVEHDLGNAGSARIEPWLRTNEGDGRRLIVIDSDESVFQLFSVGVPIDGYPVTLRMRGEVFQAGSLDELEKVLAKLLREPDVTAIMKHVTA